MGVKKLVLFIVLLFAPVLVYGGQDRLFSEAYLLMQESRFEEAAAKLEESLKIDPSHAPSNSNLALCLEKLKRYEEAVQVWRRYERIAPGRRGEIQQHIMLIGKMKEILPNLTQGNPMPVMGTISEILRDPYPESIIKLDCATYLAGYYYGKKQYVESFSLYSQAISQYRNYFVDEQALGEYAQLLSERKEYLAAAQLYRDILSRPGRETKDAAELLAECYKKQAEVYEKEGKEREALLMYERILVETPNSKYAGEARSKAGDIAESAEKQKEAGDLFFAEGEYPKAIRHYRSVIENAKDRELISYARFQTGRSISSMRRYSDAVGAFYGIAREMPESSYADDALIEVGCLLAGVMNQPEQAIKVFGLVIRMYPEGGRVDDAIFYTGYTYRHRLNNPRQAYRLFAELVKKHPESPWAVRAREEMEGMGRGR
jgi:tetratricopeptide (TPR) repeat protein